MGCGELRDPHRSRSLWQCRHLGRHSGDGRGSSFASDDAKASDILAQESPSRLPLKGCFSPCAKGYEKSGVSTRRFMSDPL